MLCHLLVRKKYYYYYSFLGKRTVHLFFPCTFNRTFVKNTSRKCVPLFLFTLELFPNKISCVSMSRKERCTKEREVFLLVFWRKALTVAVLKRNCYFARCNQLNCGSMRVKEREREGEREKERERERERERESLVYSDEKQSLSLLQFKCKMNSNPFVGMQT